MTWKQRIAAAGLGAALALVVQFEGKSNRAYLDPVGIPTICYGHTGPEVHLGLVVSDEQCNEWAADDLLHAGAGVRGCIARPMSYNVFNAFSDLAFNIGVAKFCGSTLVRRYNAGYDDEACAQLSRWNKAGGKTLTGLVRRRAAERELCEAEPKS